MSKRKSHAMNFSKYLDRIDRVIATSLGLVEEPSISIEPENKGIRYTGAVRVRYQHTCTCGKRGVVSNADRWYCHTCQKKAGI